MKLTFHLFFIYTFIRNDWCALAPFCVPAFLLPASLPFLMAFVGCMVVLQKDGQVLQHGTAWVLCDAEGEAERTDAVMVEDAIHEVVRVGAIEHVPVLVPAAHTPSPSQLAVPNLQPFLPHP